MSKIKVILIKDVLNLGKKDDVVLVSEGYAHNYLLKNNMATEFDDSAKAILKKQKEDEQNKLNRLRREALEKAEKLQGKSIDIFVRVGNNNKIFGSVSHKEIAEAILSKYQIEVDKKKFEVEDIKHLGFYDLKFKVHPEILVTMILNVKGEK